MLLGESVTARGPSPSRQASPGTALLREWQGATHQVIVANDGVIYRGQRYRSLSASYRAVSRDKAGEHRALMLAAVSRDSDQAVDLIEKHIRSTTANVIKYAKDVLGPIG